MDTKVVTIDLDTRSYDIYIGSGLIYRINDFLPVEAAGRSHFIVCDENVEGLAERISDILQTAGAGPVHIYKVPPGEKSKSLAQAEKISHWLLDKGVDRRSLVFAVGGGVVGDLTGFCASIILRGISYIQVPTTLLAQVDSSVGGKTGVNTPQGKNLIGSFYQPAAVIIDVETLESLPRRQILAGYAEIAKYGLINNAGFFAWLEEFGRAVCDGDKQALAHAIEASVRAKAEIVQTDEREQGQRALLNLGHTFGHALEAAAKYDGRVLHGEAVAMGIVMAFDVSSRMGLCPREDLERVERHFTDIGLPVRASMIQPPLNTNVTYLYEVMGRDKKAAGGKIKFVLVNGIGSAFITGEVPEDIVRAVLLESIGSESKAKMRGIKGRWKSAFSSQ